MKDIQRHHPTVDVIIPSYNVASFIGETLDSVLAQSFLPRRIIVVDDGSTDHTLQVVKDKGSPLIELISLEHKGVSHARNVGIRASRADYIAFLDADDLWLPQKLEAQIEFFMNNPQIKVIYSDAAYFLDGEVKSARKYIRYLYNSSLIRGQMEVFVAMLQMDLPVTGSASSVAVEREFLCQTPLFDESLSFAEDSDLWLFLAARQEFVVLPITHVIIRHRIKSSSRGLSCEQEKRAVSDHFYVMNKYAQTWTLSFRVKAIHLYELFHCYICCCHSLKELLAFTSSVKSRTPHYWKQIFVSFFFKGLLFYFLWFVFHRHYPWSSIRPFSRLMLFLQEGTIRFRNSKNPQYWADESNYY